MKKIIVLSFIFSLFFSFNVEAGNNPKLFGHWKNSSVSLNLKSNGKYDYKLNALVQFSGRWSSTKSKITLHYKIVGVKKTKSVEYVLDGKSLVIKKSDRPDVRLKKG